MLITAKKLKTRIRMKVVLEENVILIQVIEFYWDFSSEPNCSLEIRLKIKGSSDWVEKGVMICGWKKLYPKLDSRHSVVS